jgi:hypothetical protein
MPKKNIIAVVDRIENGIALLYKKRKEILISKNIFSKEIKPGDVVEINTRILKKPTQKRKSDVKRLQRKLLKKR